MDANSNPKFKHILITGASSGIGEGLALHYAGPGVRLAITGRDTGRLEAVAQACRERGAEVIARVISVTERTAMKEWLEEIDNARPVDLVIANAGISAGMGKSRAGEKAEQVQRLFDVNVMGVFNTIEPLLERMIGRQGGHIAIMSSMAGFRGWPGAPAYCATKAAVRVYGEALRGVVRKAGVKVHVICPGFVESRMTAVNEFPMPFIIRTSKAARIIAKGIERDKGRIAFPLLVYFFMWLLMVMPDGLAGRMLGKMPSKRESV